MNVSIKNVNNCEKLTTEKIEDIADKLDIKLINSDDYSKSQNHKP